MTYKNKEGYPDPTSGRAINGVRWEELQQLREKEHNLKRGQQVILYVKSQSEESSDRGRIKKSEKVRKSYWIVELYRHCVLLKDVKIKDPETGEEKQLTKIVNTVRFKDSSEVDGTILSEVKQGKDGASIKLSDRMKALQWLSDNMKLGTEQQLARLEQQRAQIDLLRARKQDLTGENESQEAVEKLDQILKELRENAVKQQTE